MAYNVKFLTGSLEQFNALESKSPSTFYYITDEDNGALYLGSLKLSNQAQIDAVVQSLATTNAEVEQIKTDLATLTGNVGNLDNLSTSAKGNLVEAINEVRAAISAGGTAAAISLSTDITTEGALKSYTLYQGETKIGVIDIPKDMVVESGSVVTNPDGQPEGTYIKLLLANVTEPLYINVGTLVDLYTAQQNAASVQLTIDSSTREISAVLVDGAVSTEKLADSAVTTVKIADANVTKAKLSVAVQASLDAADSAVQSVVSGTGEGTVAVNGVDVAVTGLQSAAYAKTSDFDVAGSAAAALQDANAYTDEQLDGVDLSGIQENADAIAIINGSGEGSLAATEANANAYTDTALTWQPIVSA